MLRVDGHELPVTNLDKALWPGAGRNRALTKRDLLRYLTRVSPWMLPHLADRPLFVTRFPDGITGKSFYQKHWDVRRAFARTVAIYSSHNEGTATISSARTSRPCCGSARWRPRAARLVLAGRPRAGRDAAAARSSPAPRPSWSARCSTTPISSSSTWIPTSTRDGRREGEEPELHRRAFKRTRELALRLREHAGRASASTTFVKTSGRTGLHLYLPIVRELDFDAARKLAETIARHALRSGRRR